MPSPPMIPKGDTVIVKNNTTVSRRRMLVGAAGLVLLVAGAVVVVTTHQAAPASNGNLRAPGVSAAGFFANLPDSGAEHASRVKDTDAVVVQDGSEVKSADNFVVVKDLPEKVVPEGSATPAGDEVVLFNGELKGESAQLGGGKIADGTKIDKPQSPEDMIEIQGPKAKETAPSDEECVFMNNFLDCYHYSDNDRWLVAEVHADFETDKATNTLKQVPFEHTSSTHEILKSPYETGGGGIAVMWATQMNSGQLIKVTPSDATYLLDPPKIERFGPFKIEGLENFGDKAHFFNSLTGRTTTSPEVELFDILGDPTNKNILFHQALFPQLGENPPKNIMYLTTENLNAVVAWDWTKGKDTFEAVYPIPYQDKETGWKCWDWASKGATKDGPDGKEPDMDAGDKERCPTGNRPHTMAEDKDGNIWVSLKFGAVARLSRPQDIADPRDPANWQIVNAGGEGLEKDVIFYIKGNAKGTVIWANLFKSNQLVYVGNPTDDIPDVKLYDIALPENMAKKPHSGDAAGEVGAFPAGIRVLANGDALFTVYRKFGIVGKMTTGGETALLNIPDSDDAFLHLDFTPAEDGSDEVIKLWLLASNNAYPIMKTGPSVQEVFHKAKQPETVIQLNGMNTKTMTYESLTEFRAPTQNSYLHRVTAFEFGNLAIATELLTDKFMIILDTNTPLGDKSKQEVDALKAVNADVEVSPEQQAENVKEEEAKGELLGSN